MIHIVTDSTVQLTFQEIKDNDIAIVPLKVEIADKSYDDGVTISRSAFANKLKANHDFPKTSQPSLGKFVEVYEKVSNPEDQILSIHIGSVLSGTIHTAEMAALQVRQSVRVINTGLTDRGLAFVVLKAAQLSQADYTMNQIIEQLKLYIPQIHLHCFVNNLDYLVKGGRANRTMGFISSLVKLKLELTMPDGQLKVLNKSRGNKGMQKLVNNLVNKIIEDHKITQVGLSYVDTHADTDIIEATIKRARPDIQIINQQTSPTIMTHVGPNGFAIIYI
ncbi:DegV family protein [Lactiplantibacillus plantarum]|uniref:DegV family protein n=1 Tax=Lactiplantibacillus plantarum TaxID=1590 RepID=UPI001B708656|nr:DegV family protein [Lactiplantibacillus plantarum]MBP5841755.1 DegV family protein [Lactiplantibacillus plantarum]MCT3214436.1 DegV family protein [Lactiplantibacillus plantarum]MCT3269912.1 DegV family protein [Lactiplantibacillus plantarum]